jgi:hypothetical protein
MSNIVFPYPATTGQTFTADNGVVYTYDGTKWVAAGAGGNAVQTYLASGYSNVAITGINGNIQINANAAVDRAWTFDTAGNLTLPGNAFAVNYANGAPVSLGSGGGTPGGANTQIQYNNAGAFGGSDSFTFDGGNVEIVGANLVVNPGAYLLNVYGANAFMGSLTDGGVGIADATTTISTQNTLINGTVSASGNITGNYIFGNGSQLTGITGSTPTHIQYGTTTVAIDAPSGNVNIQVDDNPIWTFDSNATLTAPGTIIAQELNAGDYTNDTPGDAYFHSNIGGTTLGVTAAGGITVSSSGISIGSTGGANIFGVAGAEVKIGGGTSGQVTVSSAINSSNTITATAFYGNGASLTNLPFANWTLETDELVTGSSDPVTIHNLNSGLTIGTDGNSGTQISPAVATANLNINVANNIWSFANTGTLTTSGNVTANNINANTYTRPNANVILTTSISGDTSTITFDQYNDIYFAWNGNSVGSIGFDATSDFYISPTGNTVIQSLVSATGNINTTANITGGNVLAGGLYTSAISATGIVYVDSSGKLNGDAAGLSTDGDGNLSAYGNVTAAGFVTSGALEVGSSTVYENSNLILQGGNAITITSPNNTTITAGSENFVFDTGGNLTISGGVTAATLTTPGSAGDITLTGGNITGANNISIVGTVISGTSVTAPVALSSLTAVAGARGFINDGNLVASGNFGTQVGNGGSNTVPVWSDGANWYIG